VSGEIHAESVGETIGSGDLSSGNGVHPNGEPEDLVSITKTESDGDRDAAVPGSMGPLGELERRLREQTAHNAELDTEVRYLLAELAVTKEFASALEKELESVHVQAGRHTALVDEFQRYRERFSHRVADRLARGIHRLPWLYRPMKILSRAVTAVASHPDRQKRP
jgi:hypothetical protein